MELYYYVAGIILLFLLIFVVLGLVTVGEINHKVEQIQKNVKELRERLR